MMQHAAKCLKNRPTFLTFFSDLLGKQYTQSYICSQTLQTYDNFWNKWMIVWTELCQTFEEIKLGHIRLTQKTNLCVFKDMKWKWNPFLCLKTSCNVQTFFSFFSNVDVSGLSFSLKRVELLENFFPRPMSIPAPPRISETLLEQRQGAKKEDGETRVLKNVIKLRERKITSHQTDVKQNLQK